MGFLLSGLVRRAEPGALPPGVTERVALSHGFELLRLEEREGERVLPGMDGIDAAGVEAAESLSANGRVAYVEAEFWAGDGTQAAVGWEDGQIGRASCR